MILNRFVILLIHFPPFSCLGLNLQGPSPLRIPVGGGDARRDRARAFNLDLAGERRRPEPALSEGERG